MWLTNIETASDEAECEGRIEIQLLDQNGFHHVKHGHCKDLFVSTKVTHVNIHVILSIQSEGSDKWRPDSFHF